MFFARVIGKVVTSVSYQGLKGYALLLVQPMNERREPRGAPVIAIDRVGVGPDEEVFCETSKEAMLGLPIEDVPADAAIVGKVDRVDLSVA
ncbi:MAG: EutN/CcmL family microcompartment protein [Candidatus Riflebacteria bacterium]|nr:EutN/CcmL family microcompartment protein [Candidatus Riflebacteria bacterium]